MIPFMTHLLMAKLTDFSEGLCAIIVPTPEHDSGGAWAYELGTAIAPCLVGQKLLQVLAKGVVSAFRRPVG
jgi:hypothetical protein